MGEIEYPFIDWDTAPHDPGRPRTKVCPRCSKGGEVCCSIEPAIRIIRGQLKVVLGEPAVESVQEEVYGKSLWVCSGRCDRDGDHSDR